MAAAGAISPSGGIREDCQMESVVKAMLPVIKRGLASPNSGVFQTSIDSMIRIERMFGKSAIDQHLETLADALEKLGQQPNGQNRAGIGLRTLLSLCSEDSAAKLHSRFPKHAAGASN